MEILYYNLKKELLMDTKYNLCPNRWFFLHSVENICNYFYIYDFAHNVFLSKKMIKSNNMEHIDHNFYDIITDKVTPLSIKKTPDSIYFSCDLGNRKCLVIINRSIVRDLSDMQIEHLLVYNIYCAYILKNYKFTSYAEMEKNATSLSDSDKQIHFVWFRKPNFKLPNKIMYRVNSWIYLNPDFKFNLWTDINDARELNDFISELDDHNKQIFVDKINVIYKNDVLNFVNEFIELHKNELSEFESETFISLFNENTKHAIIFKTDLLRNMIIVHCGGIYADFNDTVCFYPMKYILPNYKNNFLVGVDYNDYMTISNYFLYCDKLNARFLKYTIKTLNIFKHVYNATISIDLFYFYKNIAKRILDKLVLDRKFVLNDFFSIGINNIDTLFQDLSTQEKNPFYKDIQALPDSIKMLPFLHFIEEFARLHPEYEITNETTELFKKILRNSQINFINKTYRVKNRRKFKEITVLHTDAQTVDYKNKYEEMCETKEFANYHYHNLIHYILRTVMNYTNIPYIIRKFYDDDFCIAPYNYFFRYINYITLMGHLGDGTSYGIDKNYSISPIGEESNEYLLPLII